MVMIKKHKALLAYMLVLTVFTTYVVMDTFVIKRVYGEASGDGSEAGLQIENNNESGEKAEASSKATAARVMGLAEKTATELLRQGERAPVAGTVSRRAVPAVHRTVDLRKTALTARHLRRIPA